MIESLPLTRGLLFEAKLGKGSLEDAKETCGAVVEGNTRVKLAHQCEELFGCGDADIVVLLGAVLVHIGIATEDGCAVRVVPSTFLRIRENLVRCLDLGEPSCRIYRVVQVSVGVELQRTFSICLFDPE